MNGHNHSQYILDPTPEDTRTTQESLAALTSGQVFCWFCGRSISVNPALCAHCARQNPDLQTPAAVVEAEPKEPSRSISQLGKATSLMLITTLCLLIGYIAAHLRLHP